MRSSRFRSAAVSITIHTGAIALVLLVSNRFAAQSPVAGRTLAVPLIAPYVPKMPSLNAVGGGGGAHQSAPATAGHLPKIAPRQFVPPTLEIASARPKLAMDMSIEAPDAMPDRQLPNLGDPLARLLSGSGGTGGPLGIGNAKGTGVGNRRGPGAGEGDDITGPVYRAGNGVTGPVLIHSVEPEFSEDARRAKYTGTVTLRADIDEKGHPRNLRLVRRLGMGLDEKAMEAVIQWLFRPGTKDGKAVAVSALIEVSFHLL
jgi:TonB family protein